MKMDGPRSLELYHTYITPDAVSSALVHELKRTIDEQADELARKDALIHQKDDLIKALHLQLNHLEQRSLQSETKRMKCGADSEEGRLVGSASVQEAADEAPRVFAEEDGVSLEGTADRLMAMSLVDEEALVEQVPEFYSQEVDLQEARLLQEEEDVESARNLAVEKLADVGTSGSVDGPNAVLPGPTCLVGVSNQPGSSGSVLAGLQTQRAGGTCD